MSGQGDVIIERRQRKTFQELLADAIRENAAELEDRKGKKETDPAPNTDTVKDDSDELSIYHRHSPKRSNFQTRRWRSLFSSRQNSLRGSKNVEFLVKSDSSEEGDDEERIIQFRSPMQWRLGGPGSDRISSSYSSSASGESSNCRSRECPYPLNTDSSDDEDQPLINIKLRKQLVAKLASR